jgi:hypothetical protein
MLKYDIRPENTYNMDEKGFFVGITTRSKRVFSKASYRRKEVTSALQDGNREWITLLACICADGSALSPSIIYEEKAGLREFWVRGDCGRKARSFLRQFTLWMDKRRPWIGLA